MNQNIDYNKILNLKMQGRSNYDAIKLAGGTEAQSVKSGQNNKRITVILALADEYWRYGILKGVEKIAKPMAIGKRLAETAMGKDSFNSTNAIKVLAGIIMRKSVEKVEKPIITNQTTNQTNVFIIPPTVTDPVEWEKKARIETAKVVDLAPRDIT